MRGMIAARETGTVKWFDVGRGHGFITRDGGQPDCFLHQCAVHPDVRHSLVKGARVTFDVLEELGGMSAMNVALL